VKFLTLDAYNSEYGACDDARTLRAAHEDYFRYLDALGDALPTRLLELARLGGVDDGLVVAVRHDRRQALLEITLRCGNLQIGDYDLVLRYEGAELSPADERTLARIARSTLDDSRHESDLFNHEIDRTEDGRIEHRFLFHPGVWFAVRCDALTWEKVDRPNRQLPQPADRFPGGPAVMLKPQWRAHTPLVRSRKKVKRARRS